MNINYEPGSALFLQRCQYIVSKNIDIIGLIIIYIAEGWILTIYYSKYNQRIVYLSPL